MLLPVNWTIPFHSHNTCERRLYVEQKILNQMETDVVCCQMMISTGGKVIMYVPNHKPLLKR